MKCPPYNVVYALLLACGVGAITLRGVTDGRSGGLIAVAGLVTIWAGVCAVRGRESLDGNAGLGGLMPPGPTRRLWRRREALLPPGRAHRPREEAKPMFDGKALRPVQGVWGVIVGIAFVAVGTLAALGVIDFR